MTSSLAEVARDADYRISRARAELVRAVRQAAAAGMTQTQIAAEIGRSQPEVSRLLRFHGTSSLGRRLRKHAAEVKRRVIARLPPAQQPVQCHLVEQRLQGIVRRRHGGRRRHRTDPDAGD